MTGSRKQLGKLGETLAVDFLQKKNYRIIHTNYRCPFGEIDIIAAKKNVLSFIEVKTRASGRFGPPQEAVSRRKQRTIARVALAFLQQHRLEDAPARFDVVTVHMTPQGPCVDLIENAFDLPLQS